MRGDVYASSEVGWEKEGTGLGIDIWMYEEHERERVRGAIMDENGLFDDTFFLSIFGEIEIEDSLGGFVNSCFKSFLVSGDR